MTGAEILDALGIKGGVLAAGFAGGALRGLSRKPHTLRELVVSPLCGALAAAYLTGAVMHYLRVLSVPLPDDPVAAIGAVAFVIGISAMWITDILLELIARRLRHPPA